MTFTQYLLAALTLSMVSFVIGFGTGAAFVARRGGTPPTAAVTSRIQRALPIVAVVLALLIGAHYAYNVNRQQNIAERDAARAACQSRYNVAIAQTLTIRSQLTGRATENQNHIILSVGRMLNQPEPKNAKEERRQDVAFRKLFVDFANEAASIEAERAANPLPELPDCG